MLGRGSYPLRKLVRHRLQHDGVEWTRITETQDAPGPAHRVGGESPFELELARMLSRYKELRKEDGKGGALALVNLQKRLLGSVPAFARTLKKHAGGRSGVAVLKELTGLSDQQVELDDLYGDEAEDEAHSRDPSNIRLLFAWRRARRVRARLPPPPFTYRKYFIISVLGIVKLTGG